MGNVLLTSPVPGRTMDSHRGLTETLVDEIERFFKGQALPYRIDPEMLERIA